MFQTLIGTSKTDIFFTIITGAKKKFQTLIGTSKTNSRFKADIYLLVVSNPYRYVKNLSNHGYNKYLVGVSNPYRYVKN